MIKPLLAVAVVIGCVLLLLQTCVNITPRVIMKPGEDVIFVRASPPPASYEYSDPLELESKTFIDSKGNKVVIPHATTISLPRK